MTTCPLGHDITGLNETFGYCSEPDGTQAVLWRTTPPKAYVYEWHGPFALDDGTSAWRSSEFSRVEWARRWADEVVDLETRGITPQFAPDYKTALDRALETLRAIADCDEQGHEGLLWAMGEARLALADIESIEEPA